MLKYKFTVFVDKNAIKVMDNREVGVVSNNFSAFLFFCQHTVHIYNFKK